MISQASELEISHGPRRRVNKFLRSHKVLGSMIVKEDRRRCLEFLILMADAPFLPKICNAIAINGNSKPTKGDDYVPHLTGSIAWTENRVRASQPLGSKILEILKHQAG